MYSIIDAAVSPGMVGWRPNSENKRDETASGSRRVCKICWMSDDLGNMHCSCDQLHCNHISARRCQHVPHAFACVYQRWCSPPCRQNQSPWGNAIQATPPCPQPLTLKFAPAVLCTLGRPSEQLLRQGYSEAPLLLQTGDVCVQCGGFLPLLLWTGSWTLSGQASTLNRHCSIGRMCLAHACAAHALSACAPFYSSPLWEAPELECGTGWQCGTAMRWCRQLGFAELLLHVNRACSVATAAPQTALV